MIYKYFPDEIFAAEAEKIALQLSKSATRALSFTKEALNKSFEQSLDQQLQTEDLLQQKSASTNDFKEGIAAFIEKRKPDFKGDWERRLESLGCLESLEGLAKYKFTLFVHLLLCHFKQLVHRVPVSGGSTDFQFIFKKTYWTILSRHNLRGYVNKFLFL